MPSPGDFFLHLLFQFLIAVVLVFAAIGVAAGVGLIVASARTLKFFHVMNRWVSTRGALKNMEIPRHTEPLTHHNRRWVGGALIAGGVFATFGLLVGTDTQALSTVTAKGDMRVLVAVVAGTLKWFLVIGSIAGVVVGALLCCYPDALATMEKYANRWFSSRRGLRGGDDMRVPLDSLVEAYPGPSGWILACTALGAVVYAVALLLGRS